MEIVAEIKSRFPGAIIEDGVDQGHPYIKLDASLFREVMQFLRQNHVASFEQLLDVCGVDYMGQTPRFEVVHHLYSLSKQERLRVRTTVTEENCKIPSVMDIWPSADWFERETYDMLGIIFEGHPKLERLLMWDDFEGHPLRKDYPLDKRQPLPTPKEVL